MMLSAAKTAVSKQLANSTKMMVPTQINAFSEGYATKAAVTMAGEESKHRMKLPLYDIEPELENCWIAPNSTVSKYQFLF